MSTEAAIGQHNLSIAQLQESVASAHRERDRYAVHVCVAGLGEPQLQRSRVHCPSVRTETHARLHGRWHANAEKALATHAALEKQVQELEAQRGQLTTQLTTALDGARHSQQLVRGHLPRLLRVCAPFAC